MSQATFWFASPFREWIGQRSLTLSWEGRSTLRDILERLAADYPKFRTNLPREGLQDEALSHMIAVILEGEFLSLDSVIPDGAKVDVLTPLSGGSPSQPYFTRPRLGEKGRMRGNGRRGMSNIEL